MEQFDDITMLCISYHGEGSVKELTLAATVENIPTVTDFVNEQLEALNCSVKAQTQIDIAIDELFGNIAHYAYPSGTGEATVRLEVPAESRTVLITFIDEGVPFDPLKNEDPNTGLPAEERELGGLGIFMVKKSMDKVSYAYRDGKNMLTIQKALM